MSPPRSPSSASHRSSGDDSDDARRRRHRKKQKEQRERERSERNARARKRVEDGKKRRRRSKSTKFQSRPLKQTPDPFEKKNPDAIEPVRPPSVQRLMIAKQKGMIAPDGTGSYTIDKDNNGMVPVEPGARGSFRAQTISAKNESVGFDAINPTVKHVTTDSLSGCTVAVKPGDPPALLHLNPPKDLSEAEKKAWVDGKLGEFGLDDDNALVVRPSDYGYDPSNPHPDRPYTMMFGERNDNGTMTFYTIDMATGEKRAVGEVASGRG